MRRVRAALIAAAFLVVLASCAAKPPKPATLKSEVVAAEDLNPNRRGVAQPVKLHIYYLRQDEAFQQATFADLVAVEAAAIAPDLIHRSESLVGPGELLNLDDEFDPETQFIGVVAAFTRIDQAVWRCVVPVPGSPQLACNGMEI